MKEFALDHAIREAAEKSPSIKKLIDLQDAFIHATKAMHKSNAHADVLVYEACRLAIQNHAIWMAEKAGADQDLIKALKGDDCFPWHQTIYIFDDRIPEVSRVIRKD